MRGRPAVRGARVPPGGTAGPGSGRGTAPGAGGQRAAPHTAARVRAAPAQAREREANRPSARRAGQLRRVQGCGKAGRGYTDSGSGVPFVSSVFFNLGRQTHLARRGGHAPVM